MLAYDPLSNPLNRIEWAFGFLECLHITSYAVGIGSIAIVDFRLLGLGLKRHPAAQILRDMTYWTMGGLTVAIATGLLLFSTDPYAYSKNSAFLFKVSCLPVAIIYNYTIHNRVARAEGSPAASILAGLVSLLLWIPVIFGGLFYGFTG